MIQLVEWSLPSPEVHSLNPVIVKILFRMLTVNCIEKTKIKKMSPGLAQFLTFLDGQNHVVLLFSFFTRSYFLKRNILNERTRCCSFFFAKYRFFANCIDINNTLFETFSGVITLLKIRQMAVPHVIKTLFLVALNFARGLFQVQFDQIIHFG